VDFTVYIFNFTNYHFNCIDMGEVGVRFYCVPPFSKTCVTLTVEMFVYQMYTIKPLLFP